MSDKDIEQVALAICDKIHAGSDYGMDTETVWNRTAARKHFNELAQTAIDTLKSLGWLSPADAEAMAQAAQADMKERAAKKFEDDAELLEQMRCVYPGDPDGQMGREAEEARNIASAIRALTPASGPWQRVPEGFCVVREEERINIYDRMRAVEKRAYDEVEKELQEEMSKANADFLAKALAMLAEVK